MPDLTYPASHLARLEDPSTSHESAGGDRTTNRRRVLETFARHPEGLDYVTAADLALLERHEAMRRISDLERLGLLTVLRDDAGCERKVLLASGRRGRVYAITPDGVDALRGAAC